MNATGFGLGLLMVALGLAGWLVSVKVNGEAGPLVDWVKARRHQADAADALSIPAKAEEPTAPFAFGGRVHYGSTIKTRAFAIFWLVLLIGVVAAVIAVSLFEFGNLINSIIRHFFTH